MNGGRPMSADVCRGTNTATGGVQGGRSRGRKAVCPICGRRIGMRPGRAGRLYPHSPDPRCPHGCGKLDDGGSEGEYICPRCGDEWNAETLQGADR
jgi:hypothetical protein